MDSAFRKPDLPWIGIDPHSIKLMEFAKEFLEVVDT
jgi:hypothetical protein